MSETFAFTTKPTCLYCGKPIIGKRAGAKWCSKYCNDTYFEVTREFPQVRKLVNGLTITEEELIDYVGYKPNKWQEEVRKSDARFKVIVAGRRSGKTYYVAHDTKDGLVADLVDGTKKVWVVAPTYDLTGRVWNEIWRLAIKKFRFLIERVLNGPQRKAIFLKKGGFIEAKSADNPATLIGEGLHKIIIDEAAMVEKKAWTMGLRPTLADFEGTAIFISSPKAKNWFFDLYQRGQKKEKGWASWQFNSFDNLHIKKGELDEIAKDLSKLEYEQEIMGKFIEGEGTVFRNIRGHAIGQEHEPQEGNTYYMGIDLGGRFDNTAIVIINEQTMNIDHVEMLEDYDWPVQKDRLRELFDLYYSPITTMDATALGGLNAVQELEDEGMVIEPFKFSRWSKPSLVGKLIRFYEQGLITYPPDESLLAELEVFSFAISETGQRKYKAPNGKHDDIIMAFALALWPMDISAPGKAEFIPSPDNSYA